MQAITHENGDTTFILKPWELKAILAFASKDDTRAALNSVCFERDGAEARIVATDGHRLTLATVTADPNDAPPAPKATYQRAADRPEPEAPPVYAPTTKASLVRVATLLDAAKATPKGHELHVRPNCTRAAMVVKPENINCNKISGATFDVALTDARFPPWRQVVPQEGHETPRAQKFGVNAKYLADIALFATHASNGRTSGVVIVPPPGELDPLVASAKDINSGTSWKCVLMPMRM